MRGRAAAEVVAPHDALESLAAADPDHVHAIPVVENGIHENLVAGLWRLGSLHELQLAPHAGRRHAGLLGMTRKGLAHPRRPLLDEADLHGLVAVDGDRLRLDDDARTGFDDGARRDRAVRREQLGHSDFLADDSVEHLVTLFARSARGYLCSF